MAAPGAVSVDALEVIVGGGETFRGRREDDGQIGGCS